MTEHISGSFPKHVAIIPDGNGRWAKSKKKTRLEGHIQGTARVKDIVMIGKEWGIQCMTIYAFSEENWGRPQEEVNQLMHLLKDYLDQERETLIKHKIQLRAIGQIERLPEFVYSSLKEMIRVTSDFNEMVLTFAISYGAQDEIVMAAQRIAELCKKGEFDVKDITKELFSRYLYLSDLPYPDLLIRTSGEMRVSNFLLWQIAYAEIYVTDMYWPDFDRGSFGKAIQWYQKRERRFGLTSEQIHHV